MTKYEIASSLIAAISAAVAAMAWLGASNLSEQSIELNKESIRLNKDSIYLTTLNTRISTCTTLADYHKGNAQKEPEISETENPVKTVVPPVESSPKERGEKAANMARALTLCLVKDINIDDTRSCVEGANSRTEHFVTDKLGSNGGQIELKKILAC